VEWLFLPQRFHGSTSASERLHAAIHSPRKLETTAKYLNVTAQYLHELNERPLTLVKR
jgi:hypothetical protein